MFWQNLTPYGDGRPHGALADAIAQDFGSFEAFKAQLTTVASTITST